MSKLTLTLATTTFLLLASGEAHGKSIKGSASANLVIAQDKFFEANTALPTRDLASTCGLLTRHLLAIQQMGHRKVHGSLQNLVENDRQVVFNVAKEEDGLYATLSFLEHGLKFLINNQEYSFLTNGVLCAYNSNYEDDACSFQLWTANPEGVTVAIKTPGFQETWSFQFDWRCNCEEISKHVSRIKQSGTASCLTTKNIIFKANILEEIVMERRKGHYCVQSGKMEWTINGTKVLVEFNNGKIIVNGETQNL